MIKTTDYYSSFWELFQSEPKQNYEIFLQDTSNFCSFFAIHWGKIEPGTDDLVSYFLDKGYSGYIFAGKKRWNNKKLHITSVHYDDVSAQTLAFKSKLLFSFHWTRWKYCEFFFWRNSIRVIKRIQKKAIYNFISLLKYNKKNSILFFFLFSFGIICWKCFNQEEIVVKFLDFF